MALTYNDILDARNAAQQDIERADQATRQAVRLIRGRLRAAQVDPYDLKDLKRELAEFDAAKRVWKAVK